MRLGELKTLKQIIDALAEGDNLDAGDVRQIIGALALVVADMKNQLDAVGAYAKELGLRIAPVVPK